MPVAPNLTSATAIDIGTSLPYSTTQDVDNAGVSQTVWYKYVAQTTDTVIGIFAFGDLIAYTARLVIFSPAFPTILLNILAADNVPVQFPVTAGQTYFFRVASAAGDVATAVLSFSARRAPTLITQVGSILINDDTNGFPLAVLSATDGTVRRFVKDIAAGELADVLTDGTMLIWDATALKVRLYDAQFTLLASVAFSNLVEISTNKSTRFYIGNIPAVGNAQVSIVSNTGLPGKTWTVGTTNLGGMAPNPAETILYYTAGGTNIAVKRWDLANDVALTDLVAGIATYNTDDIVVLTDATILVLYNTAAGVTQVKHYSTTGSTLNTYTFAASDAITPRICRAIDETSFWIFQHLSTGFSRISNIKVSDGTVLTTFDPLEFEKGVGFAAAAASPAAFFGHSQSCPMMIARIASYVAPDPCGSYT